MGRVVLKRLRNNVSATALAYWRRFVFNDGSLMRISDFIARTITQRRALVWCGVSLLTAACIAILVSRSSLIPKSSTFCPVSFRRCKVSRFTIAILSKRGSSRSRFNASRTT